VRAVEQLLALALLFDEVLAPLLGRLSRFHRILGEALWIGARVR